MINTCDFANGLDVSLLKRIMDQGGKYYANRSQTDPIALFKGSGFNYARLRLFHTPSMHGAQVNNLEYTLESAKQLHIAGFRILLDIHYSDTWADPGKQYMPKAWEGLTFEKLETTVYDYTLFVIKAFLAEGLTPGIVQVGNEVTPGMLWEHGRVSSGHDANTAKWTDEPEANNKEAWGRFGKLLKAGIKAVGDAAGEDTSIMLHIDRGGDLETSRWFFDNVIEQGVAFDAIGQSYYPFWHGMPEDLSETLNFLATRYDKDIYLAETAYPWKFHDMYKEALKGNQDEWERLTEKYPLSPSGQLHFLRDVIEIVQGTNNGRGKGFFYWAPEWIPPQQKDIEDEADAPGCWARALFDDTGNALPALNVLNFLSKSRKIPIRNIGSNTVSGAMSPNSYISQADING